MVELLPDIDDDDAFVQLVARLLDGIIGLHRPIAYFVVKVDNWFGPKWLGFNCKILGVAGARTQNPQAPTLVPPFTPNRIVTEASFVMGSDERYFGLAGSVQLHQFQTSERNSRRKLSAVAPDAALFWWSGRSAANARGNVMSYLPGVGGHVGWYVGFRRDGEVVNPEQKAIWNAAELHGIARSELDAYLRGS
jgi:hypothetical protein